MRKNNNNNRDTAPTIFWQEMPWLAYGEAFLELDKSRNPKSTHIRTQEWS